MDIESAITARHTNWKGKLVGILFFELATSVGHSMGEPNRMDAFHMEDMPSKGFHRTAYEIKISRSDFLREIKNPEKRKAALRVSNQFYFVAPEGLIKPEEIPMECGLLELYGERLITTVNAPVRDGMPSSWMFFSAIGRRVMKMDKKS